MLIRVCAFDELAKLGDFADARPRLGRARTPHRAPEAARPGAQPARTGCELLEQHRIWGRDGRGRRRRAADQAARRRAPKDGRIRLGFMSSDLRRHPVGYFALPLFEHIDRERFDVYCYSFYQGERGPDAGVHHHAGRRPSAGCRTSRARDAAQMIADDQLDMLIELGGSTHMNKLEVMAYRAGADAGELAGLSAFRRPLDDRLPGLRPVHHARRSRELLIEKPLMMPQQLDRAGPHGLLRRAT